MTDVRRPKISPAGAGALLLDAANGRFEGSVQERIWSLAQSMADIYGVLETVPGVNNLLVVFDPFEIAGEDVQRHLEEMWSRDVGSTPLGRDIEIPVIYGGESGEDLPALAAFAGLTESEVIERHAAATYSVAAVGALPGFVYLTGIDPRIAQPRRPVPRLRVDVGTVMIGGPQAGIMPCTAPSGWHSIGRTDLVMFDPERSPPATLLPGDRIRFRIAGIAS